MNIQYCPIIKKKGTRESKFTIEIDGVALGLYARELDYNDPKDIEFLNANGLPVGDETPHTLVIRLPFEGKTKDAWIKECHLSDLNSDLEKEFDDVYLGVVKDLPVYVGTIPTHRAYSYPAA